MADLYSALPYVVDLDKPVTKTMLYNLFVTTNKKAHRFIITLRRGGVDVSFTGSVVGTLINYSDMLTQEYPGRAEDGKVVFDWPASFYAKSGLFCVIITVDDGEVSNSIFAAEGNMILGETDTLYDPSHVVPSLSELLAQIEATRNAAMAANNAADSASRAATDANSAADRANNAAQSIEGLTVSAAAGAAPDAEITEEDGVTHIHFTLKTGATPDITFEVATGAPGTQVQVQQSGTPEAPTVKLTIPRGDTGAVDGIDYFEGDPSALGTASPGTANGVARGDHVHPMPTAEQVGARPADWMPTAEDVGALSLSGTAADAEKLGGKLPGAFVSAELLWVNASPSSEFAPQTIPLNLTGYDGVFVEFEYSTNSAIYAVGTAYKRGLNARTCLSIALTNSVARYVYVSDAGCQFMQGYVVQPYGTVTEANSRSIPLRIYGFKGGV